MDVQRITPEHERVVGGPHGHIDLEVLYFCSGSGFHVLGGTSWPVDAGDVAVIPPRMVHDLSGVTDVSGWAVQFSPRALESAADGGGAVQLWRSNPLLNAFLAAEKSTEAGHFRVGETVRPRWELLLDNLDRELREQDAGAQQAVRSYMLLLLIEVARAAGDVEGTLIYRREPTLAHAFGVIERRFHEQISTRDVADAVGMSAGHLTTLVRERTGQTIGEWILERRMSEARWLLTGTDLTVEAIAGHVGFADPSYFSRRFSRLHGRPPGSWRRG